MKLWAVYLDYGYDGLALRGIFDDWEKAKAFRKILDEQYGATFAESFELNVGECKF